MRYIAFILAPAMVLAGLRGRRGRRSAAAPVKIAVFPFELEDFSAAAGSVPPDDIDREQLRLSTEEARRLLAESGRYQLVDVGAANDEAAKAGKLRDCEGCEAKIAAGPWRRSVDDRDRHAHLPNRIRRDLQDSRRQIRGDGRRRADRSANGRQRGLEPRGALADPEPSAGTGARRAARSRRRRNRVRRHLGRGHRSKRRPCAADARIRSFAAHRSGGERKDCEASPSTVRQTPVRSATSMPISCSARRRRPAPTFS